MRPMRLDLVRLLSHSWILSNNLISVDVYIFALVAMSSPSPWRTIEHIIPCQHIREYPAATTGTQNDVLHLAVKQYLPTNNPKPRAEDITIVIAPGGGFGKVLL